jgi:hypothetical protein
MAARIHQRLLATVVDGVAGFLLAAALAPTVLGFYFSSRAVVLLRIGEPDSWFQGPVAMVIGLFGELLFLLPLTLALVLGPEAFGGRGLGKRLCGIRITGLRRQSLPVRFLIKSSPLWLSALALISGWWIVEQVALAVGLGVLLGTLVPAVLGRPSIHDRIAGTRL